MDTSAEIMYVKVQEVHSFRQRRISLWLTGFKV